MIILIIIVAFWFFLYGFIIGKNKILKEWEKANKERKKAITIQFDEKLISKPIYSKFFIYKN